MKNHNYSYDLIVLAADKDIQYTLMSLLNRPQALNIRSVIAKHFIHPEHDPGCLLRADAFLRTFINQFALDR